MFPTQFCQAGARITPNPHAIGCHPVSEQRPPSCPARSSCSPQGLANPATLIAFPEIPSTDGHGGEREKSRGFFLPL